VKSGIEEGLKSAITAFGIDEAMKNGTVVDMDPLWKKAGIALGSLGILTQTRQI